MRKYTHDKARAVCTVCKACTAINIGVSKKLLGIGNYCVAGGRYDLGTVLFSRTVRFFIGRLLRFCNRRRRHILLSSLFRIRLNNRDPGTIFRSRSKLCGLLLCFRFLQRLNGSIRFFLSLGLFLCLGLFFLRRNSFLKFHLCLYVLAGYIAFQIRIHCHLYKASLLSHNRASGAFSQKS